MRPPDRLPGRSHQQEGHSDSAPPHISDRVIPCTTSPNACLLHRPRGRQPAGSNKPLQCLCRLRPSPAAEGGRHRLARRRDQLRGKSVAILARPRGRAPRRKSPLQVPGHPGVAILAYPGGGATRSDGAARCAARNRLRSSPVPEGGRHSAPLTARSAGCRGCDSRPPRRAAPRVIPADRVEAVTDLLRSSPAAEGGRHDAAHHDGPARQRVAIPARPGGRAPPGSPIGSRPR